MRIGVDGPREMHLGSNWNEDERVEKHQCIKRELNIFRILKGTLVFLKVFMS